MIERRVAGDLHVEAHRVRHAIERAVHGVAQVGDERLGDVGGAVGGEGGDQKRRAVVARDEGRVAQSLGGDHLADVGLAPHRGAERVEHGGEGGRRVAHRPVHHDGDVVGERTGEGVPQEVGGAGRLGLLLERAAYRETALDMGGPRREQHGEGRPCRDDRSAPADDLPRGQRDHSASKHMRATIIGGRRGQS